MKTGKALFLAALIFAVYLLHQDFWNWKKTEPLVLGFLPIGLAYHAGYSILAAILMAVLVKLAWPKHLEEEQSSHKSDDVQGH
jgi:uncharacterized oligopeptide transporter (OPT) family protein